LGVGRAGNRDKGIVSENIRQANAMRRANKKDANQSEIERRVKRLGVQVIDTSGLKEDTFDMIVIFRGTTYLVEVKNPDYLPKYFFTSDAQTQNELLDKLLTGNERKTKDKCELAGTRLIVTYSADHLLREIGGLPRPFGN
jgi:hypothetical protein